MSPNLCALGLIIALCTACGGGARVALPEVAAVGSSPVVHDAPWQVDELHTTLRFTGTGPAGEVIYASKSRTVQRYLKGDRTHLVAGESYDGFFSMRPRVDVVRILPDGTSRTFEDTDANDVPASAGAYFDSTRLRSHTVQGVVPGTVVVTESTQTGRDLGWRGLATFLEATSPVQSARLEVIVPKGYAIEHATSVPGLTPTVTETAGEVRYVWTRTAVPGRTPEAVRKGERGPWARVDVRAVEWPGRRVEPTAEALSRAIYALQTGRLTVSPAVRAVTQEALRDAPADPFERARRLSHWVRSNVRYVAILNDLAGFQARPADATLADRFGDCKGKAVLLHALLAADGIPSRLVLVYSSDAPTAFVPLRGVNNFNHMILAVDLPGRSVLTDPTNTYVPFGELPEEDQGRPVLPLTADGAPVETSPLTTPTANRFESEFALDVASDGQVTGSYRATRHGDAATYARSRLAPRTEAARKEVAGDFLRFEGAVVDALEVRGEEATHPDVPVVLEGKLHLDRPLRLNGDYVGIRFSELVVDCFETPLDGTPVAEVFPGVPSSSTVTVNVTLPAGWRLSRPLPETRFENEFGRASLRVDQTPMGLSMQRVCVRNAYVVGPPRYEMLRALSRAAIEAERHLLVLRRGQP